MSKATSTKTAREVKPLAFPVWAQAAFWLLGILGSVSWVIAVRQDPAHAWPVYLVNFFFFLVLGLSGVFFVAIQHITNAYWSVTVRRLAEGLISFLPVALVLALVLYLGKEHLYVWVGAHHGAGAAAAGHEGVNELEAQLIAGKKPYLNSTFFAIRVTVALLVWTVLGLWMRRNSLAQDKTGDQRYTLSNIKLAAVFLPVFAITFSFFSFDLLMSLEPTWFSTIFGVYCFSGLFYSGLALLALLGLYGRRQGALEGFVNNNHLHDVGKLMFAFTVFWAYIMFSQLMLQWYANLPEEISYYIRRFHGRWWAYSVALFLVHFVIPFFALLPREAKRKGMTLGVMAVLMLVAQWMDAYYLVMPVFYADGPVFTWVEAGTTLGFLGIFVGTVMWFLSRVPAVPVKDPRLAECLTHAQ